MNYKSTGTAKIGRPNGGVYSKGDVFDGSEFDPDTLQMLLDGGYAVETEEAPLNDDTRAAAKAARAERPKPNGKWVKDPDGIRGLSLEMLNSMVLDIDPEMEPFETVEEAVAQLSLDYED